MFVGMMFARPALINVPFFLAGTLKILYDILLYRQFAAVQPPEEGSVIRDGVSRGRSAREPGSR